MVERMHPFNNSGVPSGLCILRLHSPALSCRAFTFRRFAAAALTVQTSVDLGLPLLRNHSIATIYSQQFVLNLRKTLRRKRVF